VNMRYGPDSIVVFDGYDCDASTKESEHSQRLNRARAVAPDVICSSDTVVIASQQAFLSNQHNKSGFITLLHDFFKDKVEDADMVIVQTALDEAQCHTVTVAADDTDILVLVLLLYHQSDQLQNINLLSQTANKKTGNLPEGNARPLRVSTHCSPAECRDADLHEGSARPLRVSSHCSPEECRDADLHEGSA